MILPPPARVFAALDAAPPEAVRVVILGQDPYPTPGVANGLAFSVAEGAALPRSLANIYRELTDDLGAAPMTGDLSGWARQGVLLLNTALTVPAGRAGGHATLGWEKLTADILAALSNRPRAFVLWGKHAQKQSRHIAGDEHFVLRGAHPSPLSARRGFFGSRPFSQINDWLIQTGQPPIDWTAG